MLPLYLRGPPPPPRPPLTLNSSLHRGVCHCFSERFSNCIGHDKQSKRDCQVGVIRTWWVECHRAICFRAYVRVQLLSFPQCSNLYGVYGTNMTGGFARNFGRFWRLSSNKHKKACASGFLATKASSVHSRVYIFQLRFQFFHSTVESGREETRETSAPASKSSSPRLRVYFMLVGEGGGEGSHHTLYPGSKHTKVKASRRTIILTL